MATINVQAGAAIHVADERPGAAVDALRAIRGASKEGLRELRAILNVLRQADEADSTVPAPGLAQIDDLIASARSAGLATTLTVTGNRRPLPPEVDLAAYRIVQESLTNVIRHAGPAAATVSIGYTGTELRIEVVDTGQGVTGTKSTGTESTGGESTGGGHGLAGMRERAASAAAGRGGPGRAADSWSRPGSRWAGRRPPTGPGSRRPRERPPGRRRCPDRRDTVMIRALLADDQALIRAGFRLILDTADDIEVVGEATDGAQAVRLARSERADVVLMDIRMPGVNGLEATRRIAAEDDLAGVRVVILTTFESDEYVYQALQAGASGFLVKDTEPAELLHAVRVAARGDALLSPSVTRRLITDIASRPQRPPALTGHALDGAHRAGARGDDPGRGRPVQRRDRGPAVPEPAHRQDSRQPDHDQAERTRPGPARRDGLRERAGHPRRKP